MFKKCVNQTEKNLLFSRRNTSITKRARVWREKKTKARAHAPLGSFSTFIDFRFCGRGHGGETRDFHFDEERDKAAKARRCEAVTLEIRLYRERRRRCWLSLFPGDTCRWVFRSLSARESTRARDFSEVSFT